MSALPRELSRAQKLIQEARRVCVLTGAGISAESGIRTFRDAGGLWEDHSVEKVATPQGFAEDPRLVWKFYNARRRSADVASPNPAHLALARLELAKLRQAKKSSAAHHSNGHGNGDGNGNGKKSGARKNSPFVLLTQNIDGLHQ